MSVHNLHSSPASSFSTSLIWISKVIARTWCARQIEQNKTIKHKNRDDREDSSIWVSIGTNSNCSLRKNRDKWIHTALKMAKYFCLNERNIDHNCLSALKMNWFLLVLLLYFSHQQREMIGRKNEAQYKCWCNWNTISDFFLSSRLPSILLVVATEK